MGLRGPKKDKPVTDALRVAMLREGSSKDQDGKRQKRLNAMAEKVAKEAEKGERWAVEFVTERLEGKAPQSIGLGQSDDLEPITDIKITFVDASNTEGL